MKKVKVWVKGGSYEGNISKLDSGYIKLTEAVLNSSTGLPMTNGGGTVIIYSHLITAPIIEV